MSDNAIHEQINAEINGTDVVLFMKGTPVFPQCGFSAAVVGVLSHIGVQFKGVNVLDDDAIRHAKYPWHKCSACGLNKHFSQLDLQAVLNQNCASLRS